MSGVIVLCVTVAALLGMEALYHALERQRARWEDEIARAGRERAEDVDPQ